MLFFLGGPVKSLKNLALFAGLKFLYKLYYNILFRPLSGLEKRKKEYSLEFEVKGT